MTSISSSSSSSFSRSFLPAAEGSQAKEKQRADTDEDISDSWQSESESEASEEYVLRAAGQQKINKYKEKIQGTAAESNSQQRKSDKLQKKLIAATADTQGKKRLEVNDQETVEPYAPTTGKDTDATRTRSRRQPHKISTRQKLTFERQDKKEEQTLRLAVEQELKAATRKIEAFEAQKRKEEEASRLAREEKREREQMIARNSNIYGTKGRKPPVEIQDYQINPFDSPLERIHSYFKALESQDIVMQTVLQLLTGIALRHKKTGESLSDSLDKNAVELYELIKTANAPMSIYIALSSIYNTSRSIYIESESGELSRHYERIKTCLEGIGPESDISDINETILAAIKGKFYKNQNGQLVINLKTEVEKLIPIYLERTEKLEYRYSESCNVLNSLIACWALMFITNEAYKVAPSVTETKLERVMDIEGELQNFIQKLKALYEKYDGLQLRNPDGFPLERINYYFDKLEDQHPVKQTILQLFAGIVLHNKKLGIPLSDLPNQEIQEIYELIDGSVRISSARYVEEKCDRWSIGQHYEKIKSCFKKVGPESNIDNINKRIYESIERRFDKNQKGKTVIQLDEKMQKGLILNTLSYIKEKHIHNEACAAERAAVGYGSILFSMFDDLSIKDRICIDQDLRKLASKSGALYEEYIALQRRQTIRLQKMSVRGPGNQQGEPSSSEYAAASEHLENITASSSTPLKNTSSFRYGAVPEHLANTATASNAPLLGQRTAVIFDEGSGVSRQEDAQNTAEVFRNSRANLFGEHGRIA